MATQWNDEEDEKLQGLPHFAQLLYLRVLRRHMDYRTGIVGRKRRISYQMIIEVMYVERARGSTVREEKVTVKKIRVALQQLISAGLIEPVRKGDKFESMVFMLPVASIDASFSSDFDPAGEVCPNEEGQMKGKRAGAREGQGENVVFMRSERGYPQRGRANEGQARRGRPPDLRNIHTHTRARVDSLTCTTTPVPEDFAVSEQHVEYARAHRLPDPHDCVLAFVAHHQARGTLRENWDAEFRKWLANERVYRQGRTPRADANSTSPDPSPSTAKRPGGSHAPHQLRRQSGADIIAQGCADALEEFSSEDE